MDLKRAKVYIKKINGLFDSMKADSDNIPKIEKDLMLSHIRNLYDIFSNIEIIQPRKSTASPKPVKKEIKKVKEPEIIAKPEIIAEPEKPIEKKKEPPQKKYEKPKEIQIPESLKELAKEQPKQKPVFKPQPSNIKTNHELELLFEKPKAKELSDKLSALPIKSLAKGIAINEKILTINDLFDKNAKAYSSAIKTLDSLNNFEEAKQWLIDTVIPKYDWTDKKKIKKAIVFIKTIRRRYN